MKKAIIFLVICVSLGSGYGYGATKYLDLTWTEFYAGSFWGNANSHWYAAVGDVLRYIPIHFPEQSGTISSLKAWLGDLSELYALRLKLFRVNLSTGATELVFQISTGATQAVGKKEYTTSTVQTPGAASIDKSAYGWVLLVEGDNSGPSADLLKFYGVRITYDAI